MPSISGDEITFLYRYRYEDERKPAEKRDYGKIKVGEGDSSVAFTPARDVVVEFLADSISIHIASAKNLTGRPTEYSFTNLAKDFPGTFEFAHETVHIAADHMATYGNVFWVDLNGLNTTAATTLRFVLTEKPQSSPTWIAVPMKDFKSAGGAGIGGVLDEKLQLTYGYASAIEVTKLLYFDWVVREMSPKPLWVYFTTDEGETTLPLVQGGRHHFPFPYTGKLLLGLPFDKLNQLIAADFWNLVAIQALPEAPMANPFSLAYTYETGKDQPWKTENIGKVDAGAGTILALTDKRRILIQIETQVIVIKFLDEKSYAGRRAAFLFKNLSGDFAAPFELAPGTPMPADHISTLGNEFRVDLDELTIPALTTLKFVLAGSCKPGDPPRTIPLKHFTLKKGPNGSQPFIRDTFLQIAVDGTAEIDAIDLVSFDWEIWSNYSTAPTPFVLVDGVETALPNEEKGTYTFSPPYTGHVLIGLRYEKLSIYITIEMMNFVMA